MKETIALIVSLSIVIFTIYLVITHKIDWKLTTTFFVLSLLAGLAISNYDVIERVKGFGFELEMKKAREEVAAARDSAIEEIDAEVVRQKEEISLLVAAANQTRAEIETQRQQVEVLATSAASAEQRILLLTEASEELALLLTRITWFSQATKSEFGTTRARAATELILAELNALTARVIPDPAERDAWIKEVQGSIPSVDR